MKRDDGNAPPRHAEKALALSTAASVLAPGRGLDARHLESGVPRPRAGEALPDLRREGEPGAALQKKRSGLDFADMKPVLCLFITEQRALVVLIACDPFRKEANASFEMCASTGIPSEGEQGLAIRVRLRAERLGRKARMNCTG